MHSSFSMLFSPFSQSISDNSRVDSGEPQMPRREVNQSEAMNNYFNWKRMTILISRESSRAEKQSSLNVLSPESRRFYFLDNLISCCSIEFPLPSALPHSSPTIPVWLAQSRLVCIRSRVDLERPNQLKRSTINQTNCGEGDLRWRRYVFDLIRNFKIRFVTIENRFNGLRPLLRPQSVFILKQIA